MTDGRDGDHGDGSDDSARSKGFDIRKLKVHGVAGSAASESLRTAMEDAERQMRPLSDLQDKLAPQMERFTATQEAMEKALGPYRDLQGRMRTLGLAAGENSKFKNLADQIGAQQSAIDAMRVPEREMTRIPELPPMPPNPILETNRRLERIEERFEQMQVIAADAAEIATGLQGAAAEFLQKFEKAATDNDRAAGRAIWIGVVAVIIAVAMPAAQIIYSEYRREPSNGAEIQATLEAMQAELASMRAAQAEASDRLTDVLATSDTETAAILGEIHGLLAEDAASPPPVADGE